MGESVGESGARRRERWSDTPVLQKVRRMLVVLDQALKNKQSVGVPRE
jgi:hypothetical protein